MHGAGCCISCVHSARARVVLRRCVALDRQHTVAQDHTMDHTGSARTILVSLQAYRHRCSTARPPSVCASDECPPSSFARESRERPDIASWSLLHGGQISRSCRPPEKMATWDPGCAARLHSRQLMCVRWVFGAPDQPRSSRPHHHRRNQHAGGGPR